MKKKAEEAVDGEPGAKKAKVEGTPAITPVTTGEVGESLDEESGVILAGVVDEKPGSSVEKSSPGHSSPGSQVPVSPGSATSTRIGGIRLNAPIFIYIDPTKEDGQISIAFTTLRPSTTIKGGGQGDHVTSYRILIEICSRAVRGTKLNEVPGRLDIIMRQLMPRDVIQGTYPSCAIALPTPDAETLEKITKEPERRRYEKGVRYERTESVVKYISEMLEWYNALDTVAYPKPKKEAAPSVGAKGKGEGAHTSLAITSLQAICQYLELTQSVAEPVIPTMKELFFSRAVEPNGEFVRGMNKIFGHSILDIRKSYKTKAGYDKDKFFDDVRAKITPELIGGLFAEFFDFPYDTANESKDYNLLGRVASRHCAMMFAAFPELKQLNKHKEIVDVFVGEITKQGWVDSQETQKEITTNLDVTTMSVIDKKAAAKGMKK